MLIRSPMSRSPVSRGSNVNNNKRRVNAKSRRAIFRVGTFLVLLVTFVAVNRFEVQPAQHLNPSAVGGPASTSEKTSMTAVGPSRTSEKKSPTTLANNTSNSPATKPSSSRKEREPAQSSKFLTKQQTKRNNRIPGWKNCSLQLDGLDWVNIIRQKEQRGLVGKESDTQNTTNILCFIMTNAGRVARVKTVQDTWGKRCDHLLIASDTTDPLIGSVGMRSAATYENLWNKLNETLHYIWDTYYGHKSGTTTTSSTDKQYDWIFKVDDDSYVVMQNLRAFINSPEVQAKHQRGEPLIYGRLFGWPRFATLKQLPGFFHPKQNPDNHEFGRRFFQHVNPKDTLSYHSGGAGYIFNKPYLELLLKTFRSQDSLRGIPDEDMAVAINMWHQGVRPQPTRDDQGRERFHPESPDSMYHLYNETSKWLLDFHKTIGGIDFGPQCCSPSSISFHHIQPVMMRFIEYQLYHCEDERRERAKIPIPRQLHHIPQPHPVN